MGGAASAIDYDAELLAQKEPLAAWVKREDLIDEKQDDAESSDKVESAIYRELSMFKKREDGKSERVALVDRFRLEEEEREKYGEEFKKYGVTEELRTLYDLLNYGTAKHGDKNFYGTRYRNDDDTVGDYKWMSFTETHKKAHDFGRGLATQCKVKRDGNVGIFGINRVEWCIASWANTTRSFRTVALYDTLGEEAIEHILRHAELTVVCAEKKQVAKLIEVKRKCGDDLPLKFIVQFDEMEGINNKKDAINDEDVKTCSELGVELLGFSEILKTGAESDIAADPPTSDDLAFIMYTSGTTGIPKGAMISHGNLIAAAAGGKNEFGDTDRHFSFLTLAHMYETVVHIVYMKNGGSIAFFNGDFKKMGADFPLVDPTIFCGVPRVFQRIYDGVMGKVAEASAIKRWVFNFYYNKSVEAVRRGERHARGDARLWIPMREKLGLKSVRIVVTGAAPIAGYLAEFLRVVLDCHVIQGYGMTESAAGATLQSIEDRTLNHVGTPSKCVEIKLVGVPDMGYLPTITKEKPHVEGEIWIRGPNIFKGYYKMEEKTKEVFPDGDGFYASGDIGRMNPNGTLSIIDRKKNIFKLAQGEYVSPEKIENLYSQSNAVGQIFVYGNSFKPFLIAVVVPSFDFVASIAKEKGWWPKDSELKVDQQEAADALKKLFADGEESAKVLRDAIVQDMTTKHDSLKGFEKVRDIVIEPTIDNQGAGFHVENGCMTPSFKLKRHPLKERYKEQIIALYEKNGESGSEGF